MDLVIRMRRRRPDRVRGHGQGPGTSAPWIGANFWSRSGGPRMWTRYDPAHRARGARGARRLRLQRHALVLLLAGLRAGTRPARRRVLGAVRRFPRRSRRDGARRRSRPSSSATCRARTGTRPGGRDAICTATSGSSPSRRGSPPRSRGGSAAILRSSAGSSRTRCRSTAAPATTEEIAAWARLLVQAVRSSGATQPISLGDGAWGVEMTGADNGYSLRALAPLVDFVGPHVYPMEDDQVRAAPDRRVRVRARGRLRQARRARGVRRQLRLRRRTSTPPTTTGRCCTRRCSQERAGGSPGTTATTTTSATRTRTGTTSSSCTSASPTGDGRPKPQLHELARVLVGSSTSSRRAAGSASRGDAALVVPEHFERELPFTDRGLPARPAARDLLPGVRRRARGRPPDRARCASATASPATARLVPRTVRQAAHRPRASTACASSPKRARPSTSPTSPAARTNQRGPVAHVARRDLRRPPPAALRAGRPDRRGRGGLRLRRGLRRPRAQALGSPSQLPASRALAPTCQSTRPALRSSRSTGTAAPRSSGTRRVGLRPCSAPTRSSTWRRGPLGEPREHLAALLRARCRGGRVATGPRKRPAGPRRGHPAKAGRGDVSLRQLLGRHGRARADSRGRCGLLLESEPLVLEPFGVVTLRRREVAHAGPTRSALVNDRVVPTGEGRDAPALSRKALGVGRQSARGVAPPPPRQSK